MRIIAFAVATAMLSGSALAQVTGSAAQTPPPSLTAGETLLQISAGAEVQTPAQIVMLSARLASRADTTASARAANAILFDKVIAALAKAGGDPKRVRVLGPSRVMGFVGNEAYGDGEGAGWTVYAPTVPASAQSATMPPKASFINQIEIRFDDVALVEKITDAIEAAGASSVQGPVFLLGDNKAAAEQARRLAVAKVRADAQSYAEAFGLRVLRLTRISNIGSIADSGEAMELMMQRMSGLNQGAAGQVQTSARVWADFILGPK